ncbi:hypothetical protein [Sphingomonas sp.]|uniref:hypothetical protein n=1 Tax=Sphingomonas sp. TaxID=28214 RepID=UPI003D6D12BE
MKIFSRAAVTTFLALGLIATPALANPITSPTLGQPVTLAGSLTISVFGLGTSTCTAVLNGAVTSVGSASVPGVVTFTSGGIAGPTGCSSNNFAYPVVVRTVSKTLVRVDNLILATPVGNCSKALVDLNYNNATGAATLPTTNMPPCILSGTLQTLLSQLVIG